VTRAIVGYGMPAAIEDAELQGTEVEGEEEGEEESLFRGERRERGYLGGRSKRREEEGMKRSRRRVIHN
jgi:hypothetical protein